MFVLSLRIVALYQMVLQNNPNLPIGLMRRRYVTSLVQNLPPSLVYTEFVASARQQGTFCLSILSNLLLWEFIDYKLRRFTLKRGWVLKLDVATLT